MSTEGLQRYRQACFQATKKQLQHALEQDDIIIQTKLMIDDLHKATNQLAKRLRDWTGGWIPELDIIEDHEKYLELVATKDYDDILRAINETESIGTQLQKKDEEQLRQSALAIHNLYQQKNSLTKYTEELLQKTAPNTLAICGASITAELLIHAGSMRRLSKLPSGTIQLLGAETALFRHLKNKRNDPPKHGLLFNHPLLQGAKRSQRGRVARALADKIAIAAKIDYFKGEYCGDTLRESLEKKFR